MPLALLLLLLLLLLLSPGDNIVSSLVVLPPPPKQAMGRGRELGAVLPCPSWPSSPRPHDHTLPESASKANTCAPRAQMAATRTWVSASTSRGVSWVARSPWPSCPSSLRPKECTTPPLVSAMVKRDPQANEVTPEGWRVSVDTWTR